jgi:hypothetical protein
MLVDVLATCFLVLLSVPTGLRYLEKRQFWTLRLRLSLFIPTGALIPVFCIAVCLAVSTILSAGVAHSRSVLIGVLVLAAVVLFRYVLPAAASGDYLALRWKAWTGPSRTGVPATLTRYLGDEDDWISIAKSSRNTRQHPGERFLRVTSPLSHGIVEDAADLLANRMALDEEQETVWVPRSQVKSGVYQPYDSEEAASLLWGEKLGFRRRCSRGIISVPRQLLCLHPTLETGLSGRPLCLAHAIVARNKGLKPRSLICNLQLKGSFREFEENSVMWPRPSKTMRGFYHAELARSFSLISEAFVTAATELALLLADAEFEVVSDWLDGLMEHQDLQLNNDAATLGASRDDLARLYKGHYAAMLVSLSIHKKGNRVRPELSVFESVCRADNVPLPAWIAVDAMSERRRQENAILGQQGWRLIDAII